MNDFAQELKKQLKKAAISQGELSRRTELSATHVSNVVNGKRLPTKTTLSKIRKALGLSDKEHAKLVDALGRTKFA